MSTSGTDAAEIEFEIARVCGVINAATGRLVSLIARVLESESWQGAGIHSASQWVAWMCGVSPARARRLVLMARRLAELPETRAAFDDGELCEDQVAVMCQHAPASVDAEAADLARSATVVQLRRALGSYPFAEEGEGRSHRSQAAGGVPNRELRRYGRGHLAALRRAARR